LLQSFSGIARDAGGQGGVGFIMAYLLLPCSGLAGHYSPTGLGGLVFAARYEFHTNPLDQPLPKYVALNPTRYSERLR
jgi:hypothetical protein